MPKQRWRSLPNYFDGGGTAQPQCPAARALPLIATPQVIRCSRLPVPLTHPVAVIQDAGAFRVGLAANVARAFQRVSEIGALYMAALLWRGKAEE